MIRTDRLAAAGALLFVSALVACRDGTPTQPASSSEPVRVEADANATAGGPSSKSQCMNGGWQAWGFANQGLCIAYVNTGHDTRKLADLAIETVSGNGSVVVGNLMAVTVAVWNMGVVASPATDLRLRVVPASGGAAIATVTLPLVALPVDGRVTASTTFTAAASWPTAVAVEITVDAGSSVTEASESNNLYTFGPITVTTPVPVNQTGTCAPYTSSLGSDARCIIPVIANVGATIKVGACLLPGASVMYGDTYLTLLAPNGSIVATSDDFCGLSSYLEFTVPPGMQGQYTVVEGCYGSGTCAATVAWSVRDP
jgi:hypothetical protein